MGLDWITATVLIGWFISVLGLVTTNRQTNQRESRRAYRSSVDNLETDVDRLLKAYLTYLTEDPATINEQARLSIHSELNRVRRHVQSLCIDVGDELNERYAAIFETITGGDFETKARKRVNADRDYRRAVTAAEALLGCAENWFRRAYLRHGVKKFLLGP